ncbi:hypothetical protein DLM76_13290 [Leptospira yasudae]|uniref:DUF302 domain-containing protein n=1 Tax=Leptospira yasudae TaxID=2202201 RepID=UPI000E59DA27|nr:DUF302 domain-containing protein [Leptospira yasudae]RHX93950.1 hypothetical protein DLM76_13290 [Leptospira yasudae]TGK25769.1 DUF302 domain-containing protein [Leptospira yasudae]TGM02869.1 DUF302 domain-containing protein [Leptospira yasudae]TGM99232.1 DUF302 domain-containing protein [Leptospira yasudae]
MKYIVESKKSVEECVRDLEKEITERKYGVLHIHNLKETMKKKGVDFAEECRILEVCNPHKANQVLSEDMEMNLVLPCRISVYSEKGKTKIGMIKPTSLLGLFSDSPKLSETAKQVEDDLVTIIEHSKN